jgi:hypothetical protein
MVKNLDTKEIWKFSKSFVKREGILLLACVLAVSSSLAVVPKAEYILACFSFIILPDVSCRRV